MTQKLILIRGVSGSGKTTLAKTLEMIPNSISICADDYFYTDGVYNWDVSKLRNAHKWCMYKTKRYFEIGYSNVIVHNTSTSEKEIKPYQNVADEYGAELVSIIVENRHGNSSVHNVPEETLERQKFNILNSIKLDKYRG